MGTGGAMPRGPWPGPLPAGTAAVVPGAQARSRQRQWRSPGSGGAGPGAPGAAAAGSEGEEAKPGEEEDEEVWEDGDSGHQRLGKAQLQALDEILPFPREGKASRM
ncbi:uncharacterized protein RBU47_003845 isoform 1-T1 [Passerculus sandwichensis]